MQYTRYRSTGFRSSSFPPGVKWLLISNIGLFLLYFFTARTGLGEVFNVFALSPYAVVGYFAIWQLFTYMFLHASLGHILFNMLALWMFGADLERDWGTRRFLKYYFLCGVGAALCDVVVSLLLGSNTRTIGSSGAIYGLLLAFGVLYPDRIVLFSFLFPMKAKYFVMIIGAIAFLSSFGSPGGGINHIAHLGGMLFGYAYLKSAAIRRFSPGAYARDWYQNWKLQRARRKFQVYMRKHDPGTHRKQSDRDRFVH